MTDSKQVDENMLGSALPAAPMPGVKATDEQIDAAIREWMSDDDRSADGFRRRMRAAIKAAGDR